ncbi:MAG: DEAD/DEAH box helicase [Spirochaetales bacterium]|nr:DEAD/DEAH box helicase [Spirochaetales bacterium]
MISEAGYRKATLLQQLVLPPILEGRDVDAISGTHPGKTLAIAVALLLKLNRNKTGIKAIVITRDRDQAQKVYRALTHSLQAFAQGAVTAVIGFSDLIKKEARQLESAPDILVSTPSRLIDHIRRANIDLDAVDRIFIDEEEPYESEFESDVCYILSKLKSSIQIVRFTWPRDAAYANFEQLLKRPVVIREKDFSRDHGKIEYSYLCGENKEALLTRALLSLDFECVLILLDSSTGARKIAAELKSLRLSGLVAHREGGRGRQEKSVDLSSREGVDFIVLSQDMLPQFSLEGISHIINCEIAFWESDARKHVNLSNMGGTVIHCLTLLTPQEEKQLEAIEERDKVKIQKKSPPTDPDIVTGTVKRLFASALQEQVSDEIKAYAAAVRREVPIGKRSLFIAALVKDTLRPLVTRKIEFVTLFLGIGRLRDVGAREIASLFSQTLRLDKSRLGDIRVFDNYSFVEIDKEYADKAIAELSQKELKGRKLVINYSRKKEEKRGFGPRRHKRD